MKHEHSCLITLEPIKCIQCNNICEENLITINNKPYCYYKEYGGDVYGCGNIFLLKNSENLKTDKSGNLITKSFTID